jgi:hypothetical protein
VNLEFWHFDCSAIVTAQRILPSLFRSALKGGGVSVSNRSFSSVPNYGSMDASPCGRIFSGAVSSLRVLHEIRRTMGAQLLAVR